jgi:hypothetical protein
MAPIDDEAILNGQRPGRIMTIDDDIWTLPPAPATP